MAETLSLINVEKRIFEKHNGTIVMSNYKTSSRNSATFKCLNCDRIWEDKPYKVYSSKGCAKCIRQKKYTYQEVLGMVKSKNGVLLSKKYKNANTKLKILYSDCGHINNISLSDFMRSSCRCMKNILSSRKRIEKTDEKIKKVFNSSRLNLVSISRESKIIYVKYLCKNGHKVYQQYICFTKTKTCRDCNLKKKGLESRVIKSYSWKNKKELVSAIRLIHEKWWRQEIMKSSNYKCVITGKPFEEIHHLYPLIKIIDEGIKKSGINLETKIISKKNKILLVKKIMETHKKHPMGVCLTKKQHLLFHKKYGKESFTPENFYEFQRDMRKEV